VESTWSGESSFGGDETRGLEGEPRRFNNCQKRFKKTWKSDEDEEEEKCSQERKSHSRQKERKWGKPMMTAEHRNIRKNGTNEK
jgi:hypothetical protein